MSDQREEELITKVTRLVNERFMGDWAMMFRNYSEAGAGERIGLPGIVSLFTDAGVGSKWTRSIWGRAAIAQLDKNADKRVSWDEFVAVIRVDSNGEHTGEK